jgi:long-subunit fatty acid transport protein
MRPAVVLAVVLVVLQAGLARAQDMNYNAFQVGGRSALMGGAVVGGVRDSSAVFYNPGALAFVRETGISLSATAFRYGRMDVEDVIGPGKDLDADLVDVVPLLVSGSVRLGDRGTLGAGLVRRQQLAASFRGAVATVADVVPGLAGNETFIGQLDDRREVEDTWGTVALSWRLGERLAVGGGPVLALRRETRQQRLSTTLENATTVPPTNITALGIFFDTGFWQLSLMGRFGVAWEPIARLRLGATVTTPGLKVYGRGEELAEVSAATFAGDFKVNSFQDGLDTNHRNPFRAAVGAEVDLASRWRVGLSVEYVDRLSRRPVVETNPGEDFFQGTPQFITNSAGLQLLDERTWVVNAALGVEYRASERWAAYAGFWTDFSPVDIDDLKEMGNREDIGNPIALGSVDIYHAAVGVSRRSADRVLAVGLVGAYGTGRAASRLDFVSPEAILNVGQLSREFERRVTYFAGGLLLSFTQVF